MISSLGIAEYDVPSDELRRPELGTYIFSSISCFSNFEGPQLLLFSVHFPLTIFLTDPIQWVQPTLRKAVPLRQPPPGAYMALCTKLWWCKLGYNPCLLLPRQAIIFNTKIRSGICSASLPLVYYLVCRYFLQVERATCQRRDSTLMIILGGIFLTTSLAKYILLRPAVAQMHSVSECWVEGKTPVESRDVFLSSCGLGRFCARDVTDFGAWH